MLKSFLGHTLRPAISYSAWHNMECNRSVETLKRASSHGTNGLCDCHRYNLSALRLNNSQRTKKCRTLFRRLRTTVFAAASVICGRFTKDSSLWPSEIWRYACIMVTLIGLVGFGLALGQTKQLVH